MHLGRSHLDLDIEKDPLPDILEELEEQEKMTKKTKPGPAPTWPLGHGEGQGPRGALSDPKWKTKKLDKSFKEGYG